MTHEYDHKYFLPLGRISNEHLYGRRRGPALYLVTDQPAGVLGYTIPDQERPGYSVQRTIDDYLQDPTERHDDHNQR
jgi:hypothetical protein